MFVFALFATSYGFHGLSHVLLWRLFTTKIMASTAQNRCCHCYFPAIKSIGGFNCGVALLNILIFLISICSQTASNALFFYLFLPSFTPPVPRQVPTSIRNLKGEGPWPVGRPDAYYLYRWLCSYGDQCTGYFLYLSAIQLYSLSEAGYRKPDHWYFVL